MLGAVRARRFSIPDRLSRPIDRACFATRGAPPDRRRHALPISPMAPGAASAPSVRRTAANPSATKRRDLSEPRASAVLRRGLSAVRAILPRRTGGLKPWAMTGLPADPRPAAVRHDRGGMAGKRLAGRRRRRESPAASRGRAGFATGGRSAAKSIAAAWPRSAVAYGSNQPWTVLDALAAVPTFSESR